MLLRRIRSRIMSTCTCTKLKPYQIVLLILMYFNYGIFHSCSLRSILPQVEHSMKKSWLPPEECNAPENINFTENEIEGCELSFERNKPKHFFGDEKEAEVFLYHVEETVFMSASAVGKFVSGILGDRFDARYLITGSSFLSGVLLILLGCLPEWTRNYNKAYFFSLTVLYGIFNGFGWPTTVTVLSNWRTRKSLVGATMGFLAATQQFGQRLAQSYSDLFLKFGFEYVFLALASLMIAHGVILFFGLISSPRQLPFYEEAMEEVRSLNAKRGRKNREEEEEEAANPDNPPIKLVKALFLPGLITYCFCATFVRMVNLELFYFNPVLYMIGEIIGGVAAGTLSDFIGRSPVILIMLLAAFLIQLIGFGREFLEGEDKPIVGVTLAAGILLEAVSTLIEAAVADDIGREAAKSNSRAVSTVTGFLSGAGAVGIVIGRIVAPILEKKYGWQYVVYFFYAANILAIVTVSRILYLDRRKLLDRLKCKKVEPEPIEVIPI